VCRESLLTSTIKRIHGVNEIRKGARAFELTTHPLLHPEWEFPFRISSPPERATVKYHLLREYSLKAGECDKQTDHEIFMENARRLGTRLRKENPRFAEFFRDF